MSDIICDFCSTPNPAWVYPAKDFQAYGNATMIGMSDGGWAACDACHAYIEAGDRPGLAQRCRETFFKVHPGMRGMVTDAGFMEYITELHGKFFAARNEKAYRVTV